MKKVFISLPVEGRTDENVKKSVENVKRIVRAYYPRERLKFVDNIVAINFNHNDYKKQSILRLSKSIEKLVDVDLFVTVNQYWKFPDCDTEMHVAGVYCIKILTINPEFVCEDWEELSKSVDEGPCCCENC